MRAIPAAFLLAAFVCGGFAPSFAVQGDFLRDMPIESMSDEDLGLFMKALQDALDHEPDGATTRWENPKTRAKGAISPLRTFEKSAQRCREAEISNAARGRNNRLILSFCRQEDGSWKVEPDQQR